MYIMVLCYFAIFVRSVHRRLLMGFVCQQNCTGELYLTIYCVIVCILQYFFPSLQFQSLQSFDTLTQHSKLIIAHTIQEHFTLKHVCKRPFWRRKPSCKLEWWSVIAILLILSIHLTALLLWSFFANTGSFLLCFIILQIVILMFHS